MKHNVQTTPRKRKRLFLIMLPVLAVIMLTDIQCNKMNEFIDVPYAECEHEGNYLDTITFKGAAYLFADVLAANRYAVKDTDKDIMYIVYDKNSDLATFYASYPKQAFYSATICNFPEFAKKWKTSSEGKPIYYEGILYESFRYLGGIPNASGNFILTMLK